MLAIVPENPKEGECFVINLDEPSGTDWRGDFFEVAVTNALHQSQYGKEFATKK